MAYNNQYGPPAAVPYQSNHPSRHPQSQYQGYHPAEEDDRQYDSPYHHDNYDDLRPSSRSRPQRPAHQSPYRDAHSASPDLHPGMLPPSRGVHPSYSPSRGAQDNYSPSRGQDGRSQSRGQDGHSPSRGAQEGYSQQQGPYGPVAGAAAVGAGLGAGS